MLPVLKKNHTGSDGIYKNYPQNLSKQIIKEKAATLPQQRYQKNGDKDARGDGDFRGK